MPRELLETGSGIGYPAPSPLSLLKHTTGTEGEVSGDALGNALPLADSSLGEQRDQCHWAPASPALVGEDGGIPETRS